jgi:hypothetical protein
MLLRDLLPVGSRGGAIGDAADDFRRAAGVRAARGLRPPVSMDAC